MVLQGNPGKYPRAAALSQRVKNRHLAALPFPGIWWELQPGLKKLGYDRRLASSIAQHSHFTVNVSRTPTRLS
jgi:hypothetical protein